MTDRRSTRGRHIIELGAQIGTRGDWEEETNSRGPSAYQAEQKFAEALRNVLDQLSHLSGLVNVLAEQHEYEVTMLACSKACETPEAHGAPKASAAPSLPNAITPESEERVEEQRLRSAVEEGDPEKVCKLLKEGADVNLQLSDLTVCGLHITTGTPLVIAIMKQHRQVVQLLMHAEADPSIEYSFPAGAEQIVWSGPPIHACIPSGDLSMLRELVRLKADLDVSSSNDASLVWQAAYFGQSKILEYLLEKGLDFERRAQSQDDTSLSVTPLHAAAKAGNLATATLLLDAKASFMVDDGIGKTPLDDAVGEGHAEVVELLVSRRADIFREAGPKKGAAGGQSGDSCRCIDRVFQQNNSALVGAVARGLKYAPQLPSRFGSDDLIKFLSTPGDAACEIWSAIFRPHVFKFWEASDSKIMRQTAHAAYVNGEVGMNIVAGPHLNTLKTFFQKKQVLSPHLREFKDKLAREKSHGKSDVFMPVTFYACQLPLLQDDLNVMLAIVDCSCEAIFGTPGCRAIVEMKWQRERYVAQCRMVMAFVEVCNLVAVNVILNSTDKPFILISRESCLMLANMLALAVWVIVTVTEIAQTVGYVSHGLFSRYITHTRHIFDMFALLLTGAIIAWTWQDGLETTNSAMYRIMLGFVLSLKWARLLISLRQLKSVGLRILPILNTMWDVGPFMGVLSVYLMGAVNLLYALGRHTLVDSFLIIYRLVVLGDMDLYELELGNNLLQLQVENGTANQMTPPPSEYYEVVRVLMVVVSFVMGISMMNLFVAMLCVSYDEAAKRAPLAFVRSVAGIVLDQQAARKGFSRLFCFWRRPRRERPAEQRRLTNGSNSNEASNCAPASDSNCPCPSEPSMASASVTHNFCSKMLPPWLQGGDHHEYTAYIWFSMPLQRT